MVFTDKESIRRHAILHNAQMEQQYSTEINESYLGAIIYGVDGDMPAESNAMETPTVEVIDMDSVAVLLSRPNNEKVAVLDFASYTYPGEKYSSGSFTQEDSLFHYSNLYEVLTMFVNTYYAYNNSNKNDSLYLDRALYVHNIIFEDDVKRTCNVIVCSAPNYGIASKHYDVNPLQNHQALVNRIKFVKAVAEANNIDTLILGSWGTGLFKQNIAEVAYTFKEVFKHSSIKHIVHPIPDKMTYELFKEIYEM